jgi:hypothetical protein
MSDGGRQRIAKQCAFPLGADGVDDNWIRRVDEMTDNEILRGNTQLISGEGETADFPNLPSTVLRALFD